MLVGTFWLDYLRREDADIADKHFYGGGIVVGPQHILAQRRVVRDIILPPARVGETYWKKPIQFVVEAIKNYTIHNINGVETEYGRSLRHFSLKDVGSIHTEFVLLRREKNQYVGIPGNILLRPIRPEYPDLDTYRLFPEFARNKTKHGSNCTFYGWSQHPQGGSYNDNIRQYVRFPVKMKEDSCQSSNNFCEFYKSDGLPGGFCNTFQDAGSLIICQGGLLHYITIYNEINRSSKTCNGTIDAYFVPHFQEELERLLKLDIAAMKEAKAGK